MNMNCYFRSRDLYKAWFMNVFALTSLQEKVAKMVSERLERKVKVGEYSDTSDSLHIYGAYFKEFEEHLKPMNYLLKRISFLPNQPQSRHSILLWFC